MHDSSTVEEVLRMVSGGMTVPQIVAATSLPRSTVRDWLDGRAPGAGRPRDGCDACGRAEHRFDRLGSDYAYLLGLYLGDGCISAHRRGVFKLRITLDLAYPKIVDECAAAMGTVMPTNRVNCYQRRGRGARADRFTHVDVYSYSRAWPCLLPQHGPGMKHTREIRLVEWQEAIVERHADRLLRGLIHSDGCRSINTGTNWIHPRYSFHNASADIRGIFERACDSLGLHTTRAPRTVYVSRKADVAILDTFVGAKR